MKFSKNAAIKKQFVNSDKHLKPHKIIYVSLTHIRFHLCLNISMNGWQGGDMVGAYVTVMGDSAMHLEVEIVHKILLERHV